MKNLVGGLSKSEKIFIYKYFIFFFFTTAKATTILDHEIETFINDILSLVSKTNNFNKEINFSILLDDNANAFVNQDTKLFISTGLIKYTTSYEAFLGVLAHELGHIEKYHIAKRKKSIKNLKDIDNITNLSLIAGSLIANNSEYLMQSIITNKVGISNYYKSFSRDQEREADYYAVETLNKLRLSADPLIEFLSFLEKQSIQKGYDPDYKIFSTHPVYEERFTIINSLKSKEEYDFDQIIESRFNFIKAKLFGFTENNTNSLNKYLEGDYLNYAKSIILSKKGKLKESMILLNNLLTKDENISYLLETKADILFASGYSNEALLFYEESSKNIPHNYYVKKRIFDINFSKLSSDEKMDSLSLFKRFSYLLEIFYYNKDLKNKFETLAKKNNLISWINFFNIKKIEINNISDRDNIIKRINQIRKESSDKVLIRLVNKHLSEINEKF